MFRSKVTKALEEARKVLGTARNPCLPTECSHTYDDKYLLAEIGTRTAILAIKNALDQATNNSFSKNLPQMIAWARDGKTVTLHTDAEELCSFISTKHREVKSSTSKVTEKSGVFGKTKKEEYTITRVTEHEWNCQVNWETYVYPSDDVSNSKIVLQSSTSATTMTTRGDKPNIPKPAKKISLNSPNVELSWLLKALDRSNNDTSGSNSSDNKDGETKNGGDNGGDNEVNFTIDRSDDNNCHTPRRNLQIDTAINHFRNLMNWQKKVSDYLLNKMDVSSNANNVRSELRKSCSLLFDPVPATFVLEGKNNDQSKSLTPNDITMILNRQNDVYHEQYNSMMDVLNSNSPSMHDACSIQSILGGASLSSIFHSHNELVNDIEKMLEEQLISAIGKVVQPSHFAEYMNYHHRNLFNKKYAPKGFCHAVRRPNHYPEGTLALEQQDEKGDYHPVPCMVAHRSSNNSNESKTDNPKNGPAMTFPLNAASDLTFFGDQYLHSFVVHQFSGRKTGSMRLAARARQFSSFILMVGKLSGPSSFDPESAIIIQNKDDLLIPLILETIPTPKEFKDAISSLSPEQKRFAQAFRGMQLNSTLFGIVIIQIKPQLERVLNLKFDSLTKEIKLTQDLMKLFIEYQIPPDLLSYTPDNNNDGDENISPINVVKKNVSEIMSIINNSKGEEIQEQYERTVKHTLSAVGRSAPAAPSAVFSTSMSFGSSAFGGGGGRPQMAPPSMVRESMARAGRAGPPARGGPPARKSRNAPQKKSRAAAPVKNTAKSLSLTELKSSQTKSPETKSLLKKENTGDGNDWTNIPKRMDEDFEKLDTDSALRPTIIKLSETWERTTQHGLLSKPKKNSNFNVQKQKIERNKTFDLLDALTRSGVMAVETGASLHVVLCATHCFDKSLMNTLIQDNVNPIEKVERSSLIMASTIHQLPPSEMILQSRIENVKEYSPMLFNNNTQVKDAPPGEMRNLKSETEK